MEPERDSCGKGGKREKEYAKTEDLSNLIKLMIINIYFCKNSVILRGRGGKERTKSGYSRGTGLC